jgi:hypothetical protein
MYIDLLTQKKNICRSSHSSSFNSTMSTNGYTVKTANDILSWAVTANEGASAANFTIISALPSYFVSLGLTVLDTAVYNKLLIELSNDYITWSELSYKQRLIDNNIHIYRFIEKLNGINMYAHIETGEVIQETADMSYCFVWFNPHTSQNQYLYGDVLFSQIRFTFEFAPGQPAASALQFTNLVITIDEYPNMSYLKKNALSEKVDTYFRSKIFETQPFMPDQVKTFLSMLEKNNSQDDAEGYKHIFLQKSLFSIEEVSNSGFGVLPAEQPIETGSIAPRLNETLGRDLEAGL